MASPKMILTMAHVTSVKALWNKNSDHSEPRPSTVGNIRGADCFHRPFASEAANFNKLDANERKTQESQAEERIQGMMDNGNCRGLKPLWLEIIRDRPWNFTRFIAYLRQPDLRKQSCYVHWRLIMFRSLSWTEPLADLLLSTSWCIIWTYLYHVQP